jgi:hypothetical protein
VRGASDVERRPPVSVAVLRELKIPPLAVQSHSDQPDADPRVHPPMQELRLGRAGRELEKAERGAEVGAGCAFSSTSRRSQPALLIVNALGPVEV